MDRCGIGGIEKKELSDMSRGPIAWLKMKPQIQTRFQLALFLHY